MVLPQMLFDLLHHVDVTEKNAAIVAIVKTNQNARAVQPLHNNSNQKLQIVD